MIPRLLAAPPPGWTVDTDVVVVGSGIAGLVAALRCRPHGRVLLVTGVWADLTVQMQVWVNGFTPAV